MLLFGFTKVHCLTRNFCNVTAPIEVAPGCPCILTNLYEISEF